MTQSQVLSNICAQSARELVLKVPSAPDTGTDSMLARTGRIAVVLRSYYAYWVVGIPYVHASRKHPSALTSLGRQMADAGGCLTGHAARYIVDKVVEMRYALGREVMVF